jgi:peptide/nickel transport system substrate-binding protein
MQSFLSPRAAMLAAAMALAPALSVAPGQAQTLNIGIGAPITSLDPHFFNAGPNNGMATHIFRFLTQRDAGLQLRADLAESWTAVSETVWEFKLRQGVTWHDGRPLTAEDVAFTVARAPNVPNSPGGYGGFLAGIQRLEVVDAHTVRFHMASPSPLLPSNLAAVAIIAKHAADGASTADFNSTRAAVGAGPYRAVSYASGDRVVLERFDGYVPANPAEPRAHWARVNYRMIVNDGGRVAAVLAGDVDIIDQIPGNDLARLKTNNALTIYEIQGVRVVYIAFDFVRDNAQPGVTDNAGQPLASNPFRDVRVRRALSMGINRAAIADRVMSGTASPNGQWLPPGTFGHNAAVQPTPFDADQARRLLAEAGFPQGFKLTLFTPNDRWANDAQTAQAIAQFWTRIGITTQIEAQPWAAFSGRSARNEFPIRMASWGSSTGEASYTLVNVIGTRNRETRWGAVNSGLYSNEALDALTRQALATLDDEKREAILREAVQVSMDDVAIMPIHQLKNFWAARRGFTYEPRMDERTLAFHVRPAN